MPWMSSHGPWMTRPHLSYLSLIIGRPPACLKKMMKWWSLSTLNSPNLESVASQRSFLWARRMALSWMEGERMQLCSAFRQSPPLYWIYTAAGLLSVAAQPEQKWNVRTVVPMALATIHHSSLKACNMFTELPTKYNHILSTLSLSKLILCLF